MIRIAYFITPHGFGHAARATAVMLACLQKCQDLWFEVYTTVPQWFFEDSRLINYTIHPLACDVGMVQKNSMEEDIPATIKALQYFYPVNKQLIEELSREFSEKEIRAVLCDVAPLGILAAHQARIPSLLIENFTWDWIYEGYLSEEPDFQPFIEYLQGVYRQVIYHIQTQPACSVSTQADLNVFPVSRPIYSSREEIRKSLTIPQDVPAVLITMGGIESNQFPFEVLKKMPNVVFIVPGGAKTPYKQANLILLPHRSGYYHTDLMNACDAVIGKLGYSTLAEAYWTGTPYGFIPRARFRESPPLAVFAKETMGGLEIPMESFWGEPLLSFIEYLIQIPKKNAVMNGSEQIADFLMGLVNQKTPL
ncbi:glycosyltransferase family protein [Anaerolinea thermophila]|uniref:Glycosyl transferase family 28 C-terminal domain-containing protein n=2 Tax=Anaerolinea TaxID=233189 RepID=E8N523_ANATU|nr:glycosyltransferase family protein [Anaerolinea thermophila]BAJ63537.1 hypothetical protein ANT_15090 [Anaerolinea thermophila UNI-1]